MVKRGIDLPLEALPFYCLPHVVGLHSVLHVLKECMDRKVARELPLLRFGFYVVKWVKIIAKPV